MNAGLESNCVHEQVSESGLRISALQFYSKKGSDKEEYAKDAVTGRAVHRLEDRLTGSLRKVALEPDV